jgi:hypothetical protein
MFLIHHHHHHMNLKIFFLHHLLNQNVSDVNSTIQLVSFDSQNLSSSSSYNQKGASDVNFVTPSSSLICGPSNNTVQVKSTPDDISKLCNDLPAHEGTFPAVKSLLSSNYIQKVVPNEV